MNRERREANLQRLLAELAEYAAANGLAATPDPEQKAEKIAAGLPLAHSTTDAAFVRILNGRGSLLSPARLETEKIKTLRSDAVEITLGTERFVFLYAGPNGA